MADSFEDQGWVRLGVAGALAKDYGADERAFLANLAGVLQTAFPDQTEIKKRGLFTKTVASVCLTLGDAAYRLEDLGRGPLHATKAKMVRGIALKREELSTEEWLAQLGDALEVQVQTSARGREALANMLGLS